MSTYSFMILFPWNSASSSSLCGGSVGGLDFGFLISDFGGQNFAILYGSWTLRR